MKLSILVLSYNQESYIERTIESIASQILDINNTEIVVADDCSMDNTQSVIMSMTKKYLFVKPIFNNIFVTIFNTITQAF